MPSFIIVGFVWRILRRGGCQKAPPHPWAALKKSILNRVKDWVIVRSDLLLFSNLMNIVSILFYNFIEFIIFLYTFLVNSFAWYKEYIICLISFSKFSDALPIFTYVSVIGNLWSICLGLNILKFGWLETLRLNILRSKTLATWVTSEGCEANIRVLPLPFCWLLKLKILSTL